MAAGLRCWDASGTLLLDVSDRLTRTLGAVFVAAGASGTITDDGFLTGTPFKISIRTNAGGFTGFNATMIPPAVSFAGNQMTYVSTSPPTGDHYILYGVY